LFVSALQAGRAKTEEEKAEALKHTFAAYYTKAAQFYQSAPRIRP
jgi:Mlc titration factor MtfA (ptsG expression regulator)